MELWDLCVYLFFKKLWARLFLFQSSCLLPYRRGAWELFSPPVPPVGIAGIFSTLMDAHTQIFTALTTGHLTGFGPLYSTDERLISAPYLLDIIIRVACMGPHACVKMVRALSRVLHVFGKPALYKFHENDLFTYLKNEHRRMGPERRTSSYIRNILYIALTSNVLEIVNALLASADTVEILMENEVMLQAVVDHICKHGTAAQCARLMAYAPAFVHYGVVNIPLSEPIPLIVPLVTAGSSPFAITSPYDRMAAYKQHCRATPPPHGFSVPDWMALVWSFPLNGLISGLCDMCHHPAASTGVADVLVHFCISGGLHPVLYEYIRRCKYHEALIGVIKDVAGCGEPALVQELYRALKDNMGESVYYWCNDTAFQHMLDLYIITHHGDEDAQALLNTFIKEATLLNLRPTAPAPPPSPEDQIPILPGHRAVSESPPPSSVDQVPRLPEPPPSPEVIVDSPFQVPISPIKRKRRAEAPPPPTRFSERIRARKG